MKPDPLSSPFAGLHVLVDDDPRWQHDPVEQAEAACAGGASVIQLRAKHAADSQILDWARKIRASTRQRRIAFVVNDRFDLALAAEADAVHLGQDDMPPAAVPASKRSQLAIGRSTHTLEEVHAALHEPIAYLAFGPVFGTTSKHSPHRAPGLEALAQAVAAIAPIPLVAIGGIDPERAALVVEAGAAGVAVISAVAAAAQPELATRALCAAIDRARGAHPR